MLSLSVICVIGTSSRRFILRNVLRVTTTMSCQETAASGFSPGLAPSTLPSAGSASAAAGAPAGGAAGAAVGGVAGGTAGASGWTSISTSGWVAGLGAGAGLVGAGFLAGFFFFLACANAASELRASVAETITRSKLSRLGIRGSVRLIPEVNQSLNDNPERRDNNTFSTAAARDRFF